MGNTSKPLHCLYWCFSANSYCQSPRSLVGKSALKTWPALKWKILTSCLSEYLIINLVRLFLIEGSIIWVEYMIAVFSRPAVFFAHFNHFAWSRMNGESLLWTYFVVLIITFPYNDTRTRFLQISIVVLFLTCFLI